MGPLAFVNWRAVNQLFCFLAWMMALALTLVIVGHYIRTAGACASRPVTPGASVCVGTARHIGPGER
jgi:hypothetical protein